MGKPQRIHTVSYFLLKTLDERTLCMTESMEIVAKDLSIHQAKGQTVEVHCYREHDRCIHMAFRFRTRGGKRYFLYVDNDKLKVEMNKDHSSLKKFLFKWKSMSILESVALPGNYLCIVDKKLTIRSPESSPSYFKLEKL